MRTPTTNNTNYKKKNISIMLRCYTYCYVTHMVKFKRLPYCKINAAFFQHISSQLEKIFIIFKDVTIFNRVQLQSLSRRDKSHFLYYFLKCWQGLIYLAVFWCELTTNIIQYNCYQICLLIFVKQQVISQPLFNWFKAELRINSIIT